MIDDKYEDILLPLLKCLNKVFCDTLIKDNLLINRFEALGDVDKLDQLSCVDTEICNLVYFILDIFFNDNILEYEDFE